MAKRITALKCPQCGSVKKQSIKEDHYICNHCDTEYFLDNDDINVHINHHRHDAFGSKNLTKKNVGIIVAALAIVLLAALSNIFFDAGHTAASPDTVYTDYPRHKVVYTGADGQPKILIVVERRYGAYSKKDDEHLFIFYDPIQQKVIHEQQPDAKLSDNPSFYHRKFADGALYFVAQGATQLFVLDTLSNKLLDVSPKLLHTRAELASGIATLKFSNDNYGDGLDIMTNDGKEFIYFPLAQKIYGDRRDFYKDAEELSTLPSDAIIRKYYIFSEKSSSFPDEPIQLIQYNYQEKPGFPIRLPYRAEWNDVRDYRYSGNVTYKSVFSSHDKRVSSFKNLTPGRLYFKPAVMYQEENRLYIKTGPNANPDNSQLLQKIDTYTGEVLWTYKPDAAKAEFDDLTVYKDGVGLHLYNFGSPRIHKFVLLSDQDGTLIQEIDLDNFKLNKPTL